MWVLSKMSLPNDWTKEFCTEHEALQHLRTWVCDDCLNEAGNIDDALLGTACGCEFWLYEEARK